MTAVRSELEFEDLLDDIGGYGKYQRRLITYFLIPSAFVVPAFTMNIILMVYTPDHWCSVPEVAASNLSLDAQRALIAPRQVASCFRYDLNYTEALAAGDWTMGNDTSLVACDKGWRYDTTHFEETAASKWNMVCEDEHYSKLVMTLTNVGSIIGTPIYGTLSDRIGRKPVFFIVIAVTAVTAVASILMTDFIPFLILRTINGSLMPSVFQIPFIILLEIVAPNARVRMNGISTAAWTFGLCTLPLLAYLTKHWVPFGLITSASSILMFVYLKFLPESPRWLISKEKYGEAAKILTKISETNGKPVDPLELRMKIKRLGERIKKEKNLEAVTNTSMDLLRYPNLRKKFLIITFCWVADMFAYYGLQINVMNLVGNPFLNFFLLAVVEVPGILCSWYFMERWGRRWCSVSALLLTGAACLLGGLVAEGVPYGAVAFSLIGKFGSSASFMAVYQQSSELYPTTIRSIGMGMSGTCAGMANIVVPYIIHLALFGKFIPFVVIGVTCLVAGLSAVLLPETLNQILPQTIHDAEAFGKGQGCLSCSSGTRAASECSDEQSPELLKDLQAAA